MEKTKNFIVVLLPLLVIIGTFIVFKSFDKKSYAADTPVAVTKKYAYIRRNMLSHHYITSNYNPSGTILLKTGARSSVNGDTALAYCAHKGKNIAGAGDGHWYTNVLIDKTKVSAIKKHKDNLKAVISNSYPYISLPQLKEILKNSLGETEYNKYNFDALDVQESMTATQAAIWNGIAGKLNNQYRATGRVGEKYYKNFHKGTGNSFWPINWDKSSAYYITEGCYKGIGPNLACGSKSTILQDGDTKANVSAYKKGKAVEKRINKLISWYFGLRTSSIAGYTEDSVPDYYIDSYNFNTDNTVDIILGNVDSTTYVTPDTITFTDNSGNNITYTTSNVTLSNGNSGVKYTLASTTSRKILIHVEASVLSSKVNVYVYETNISYSNTQYLIGGERGNIAIETDLEINDTEKGKLRLYKTGSETESKIELTTSDVCGTSDNPCLSYATFGIYTDRETQNLVKSFITGEEYTELDLSTGTYYLKELSAPGFYQENHTVFEFTINKDETTKIHAINKLNKLCIKKIDKTTGKVLDGARFMVESAVSGMIYEVFDTSEQQGVYCLNAELESGYYYITEVLTPANYSKEYLKYKVNVGNYDEELGEENVDENGLTIKTIDITDDIVTITNQPGLTLSKSDITNGVCVSGAKLTITDKETGEDVIKWISTCSTDKNGNPTGKDDSYEVPVCKADGTPSTIDPKCNVPSSEDDEGDIDVTIEGENDPSSEVTRPTIEGGTGLNCGKCITPGKTYILKEEMTEELREQGYSSEAEVIEFSVNQNGKVTNTLDMKDGPIQVCIYKVEKGTNKPISGAKFKMYREDKTTLFNSITSTENEQCLTYVPYGTYYIKEIQAPNGYKALNEEIKIEVKDTKEKQYFYIENEVIAPKTSLDNTKLLIIISSIFMLFGIGMVGYYGFKKKN